MKKSWKAKKSAALRSAMLAAVTQRDIYNIVKCQVFIALKGDTLAAREVLDRCVGKAVSMTEMIAIESASNELLDRDGFDAESQAMLDSVPSAPEKPISEESDTA